MYEAGIKYILGLRKEGNILKIEPCIPNDWNEYSIKYKYANSIYNIKVIRKNLKEKKIYLDGEEVKNNEIILIGNGGVYGVEVEI